MPPASVGANSGAASQNQQVYEVQIKNLEKQKEQITEKIHKLRHQGNQPAPQQVEQEIPAYEVQLQSIEAQIEHLEQKQANLETAQKDAKEHRSSPSSSDKKPKKEPSAITPVDVRG